MPFPLNYSAEINSPGEFFQDQFKRCAQVRLENAKAEVEFDGPELCFHTSKSFTSFFRIDSSLLSSVPSGKFIFREGGGIAYYLNFTEMCLWLTAWVLGIFGFFFLFIVSGPLLIRLLALMALWAGMIGFSFALGIYRFNQFVARILGDIG